MINIKHIYIYILYVLYDKYATCYIYLYMIYIFMTYIYDIPDI